MSPPIREGSGNDIGSIRLGDGSEIAEVRTGAGDVLFSAIPDTSMFNDPVYQYYAGLSSASDGEVSAFPEGLAGLSSATSNGDPVFNSNFNGYPAFFYSGSNSEYHNYNVNGSVTDQNHSVAILFYKPTPLDTQRDFMGFSNIAWQHKDDKSVTPANNNVSDPGGGGSISVDQWTTTGFSYNGSTIDYYANGTNVRSSSFTNSSTTPEDSPRRIGNGFNTGVSAFQGYIAEVVFTNSSESDQAFSDYHNNRIPP